MFKALRYTKEENENDCCVLMGEMKRLCIGEDCFSRREKLDPTETLEHLIAELKENWQRAANYVTFFYDFYTILSPTFDRGSWNKT